MTTQHDETIDTQNTAETEAPVSEEISRLAELTPEELSLELMQAQQKAADLQAQNLRLHAEMENVRRRAERDVSAAHKFGIEKLLKEIVPVLESFEHGLNAVADSQEPHVVTLREGMELTHKMLLDTLKKQGVVQINPEGMPFNAAEMEALSMVPNPNVDPNTVINVIQKGYKLHDRLLKPAMVVVSK